MARVRSKVERALGEQLNSPELRDRLADTVTKYLSFANTDASTSGFAT